MSRRVVVPPIDVPAVLQNARVSATEVYPPDSGESYIAIRFDNGATLYADAPTLYRQEVAQ